MVNTDTSLAVIVLAAGQGTRMKSATPKVLHRIGGRSLVGHVLATAQALQPAHVVTVVRHERDLVAAEIAEQAPDAIVVDQDDVPGTGRAVEVAFPQPAPFRAPTGGIASPRRELAIRRARARIAEG